MSKLSGNPMLSYSPFTSKPFLPDRENEDMTTTHEKKCLEAVKTFVGSYAGYFDGCHGYRNTKFLGIASIDNAYVTKKFGTADTRIFLPFNYSAQADLQRVSQVFQHYLTDVCASSTVDVSIDGVTFVIPTH